MRAVRFDHFGGTEVLKVLDVADPEEQPGRAIIRVRAAGINPGESAIRRGDLEQVFPTTFPCGQGSDLAGEVVAVPEGAPFAVGDAVMGWSDQRSSHAELVSAPLDQLMAKPDGVSWEVAGSLYVAGMAGRSSFRSVGVGKGETVVVSAAAGGVGLVAAQLAVAAGATVIGLASEANHEWLSSRGIIPVRYGEGQEDRIRDAAGGPIDAFIDTFGGGYVDLAIALGVAPERINTVFDFEAAGRIEGVRTSGTADSADTKALGEVAAAIARGDVEVPIAATYPLDAVGDAFDDLDQRHSRGKIVLLP